MKERLSEIRKYLKLNQEDFGKKIELSKPSISALENGTREITERTTKDICREYNVNEIWLKTGKGYMFVIPSSFEEFIAANYKFLDEVDKKIITEYIKLNPDHRSVIKKFIQKMI